MGRGREVERQSVSVSRRRDWEQSESWLGTLASFWLASLESQFRCKSSGTSSRSADRHVTASRPQQTACWSDGQPRRTALFIGWRQRDCWCLCYFVLLRACTALHLVGRAHADIHTKRFTLHQEPRHHGGYCDDDDDDDGPGGASMARRALGRKLGLSTGRPYDVSANLLCFTKPSPECPWVCLD
jgi:hypothetical protein